jgi:hypothetical protein
MRIVGGRLRGRALVAPKSQAIRPTADRLREALFNILVHAYGDPVGGARVLDLFAGTGALGLEAGPPLRCSSMTAPRRARSCGRTSRRWAWGASAAFSGAMRSSSVPRIRCRRSRSRSSIRPMGALSPKRRSPRRAPVVGLPRAHSRLSRRRQARPSPRPKASTRPSGAVTTTRCSFYFATAGDALGLDRSVSSAARRENNIATAR